MKTLTTLALALSLIGLTGTAAAYDCSNAQHDLKRLESEKQSTLDRIAKGAMAILPIGAAVNVLQGKELDSLEELNPQDYQRYLDQKIEKIKATCHLQ